MDPFVDLPDEMIVKICQASSDKDLVNLSRSSSEMYRICNDVIKERKLEAVKRLIGSEKLGKGWVGISSSIGIHHVLILNYGDRLLIMQRGTTPILPGMNRWRTFDFSILISKNNLNALTLLYNKLISQGYKPDKKEVNEDLWRAAIEDVDEITKSKPYPKVIVKVRR